MLLRSERRPEPSEGVPGPAVFIVVFILLGIGLITFLRRRRNDAGPVPRAATRGRERERYGGPINVVTPLVPAVLPDQPGSAPGVSFTNLGCANVCAQYKGACLREGALPGEARGFRDADQCNLRYEGCMRTCEHAPYVRR